MDSEAATAQHLCALERANRVRLARAQLKRSIASGSRTVADVVASAELAGLAHIDFADHVDDVHLCAAEMLAIYNPSKGTARPVPGSRRAPVEARPPVASPRSLALRTTLSRVATPTRPTGRPAAIEPPALRSTRPAKGKIWKCTSAGPPPPCGA
jgi:hypothetical protein